MKLSKIKPKILGEELKYIYTLRSEPHEKIPPFHRHFPDGTFELILNLGDPIYQINNRCIIQRRPDVVLVGGFRKFFQLRYTGQVWLVGAVFKAGYSSRIKNFEIENKETFIQAEKVFGDDVFRLMKTVAESGEDDVSTALILEGYLINHFGMNNTYYLAKIQQAAKLIFNGAGKMKVKDIAGEVFMSARNFRRVFTQFTGYSPILFSRITRAKHLLHFMNKGGSLVDATHHLGFYDASHIIRDFRELGGLPPSDFVNQMNGIDNLYSDLTEYKI